MSESKLFAVPAYLKGFRVSSGDFLCLQINSVWVSQCDFYVPVSLSGVWVSQCDIYVPVSLSGVLASQCDV